MNHDTARKRPGPLQVPEGMVENMPSEEFEAEARAIVARSVQESNPTLADAIARAREAVAKARG
jgi:hypothetical protein